MMVAAKEANATTGLDVDSPLPEVVLFTQILLEPMR